MKSPAAWSPAERERRLKKWAAESAVELSGLDEWQREYPHQVLLVRAPRRSAYLKQWQQRPEKLFTSYEEPGRPCSSPEAGSADTRGLSPGE